jgi:hypothetical protein
MVLLKCKVLFLICWMLYSTTYWFLLRTILESRMVLMEFECIDDFGFIKTVDCLNLE